MNNLMKNINPRRKTEAKGGKDLVMKLRGASVLASKNATQIGDAVKTAAALMVSNILIEKHHCTFIPNQEVAR
jgi:hypothetical protein